LATLALQDVWVLSKFDQNTKKKNLRFLFDWANLLKLLKQSVNADGLSLGILGNPCPAILAQTETASEAVFYGSSGFFFVTFLVVCRCCSSSRRKSQMARSCCRWPGNRAKDMEWAEHGRDDNG